MQRKQEIIAGLSEQHLAASGEFAGRLHPQVAEAFVELRSAAAVAGFDLRIASAFRSFDRQLHIWNAKARGDRPIHNERGETLEISALSRPQLMHAILRWSALPGASRHHWGTDMDVYDAHALEENVGPKLLVAEYEKGGPFAALNLWLEEHLSEFGFYRPYHIDRGGIAPEPWHISYQPVAMEYESGLTTGYLNELLDGRELELVETVLQHLDEIFERYIQIT